MGSAAIGTEGLGGAAPPRFGHASGDLGLDPFWRAAVRLHRHPDRPGGAEDAAAALCDLARSGASSLLTSVLRVDLGSASAGWTVACYEIGDTAPSALHEHDAPAGAISALMECGTPSHIASELVCNGEGGLQWVAMTRARTRIRFQLPDELNTSARRSSQVNVAMRGWQDHLDQHRHLDRPAVPPAAALVRAPRAAEVVGIDHTVSPTPLAAPTPSAPSPVRSDGAPVPSDGSWADDLDDDGGMSHAALAALGLAVEAPSRPAPAPSPAAAGIDARTLNTAMRSALAGAVPYLEQYLLDSVAERVAALATTLGRTDDRQAADVLAEIRREIAVVLRRQEELTAELRSVQRQHLNEVLDLNERIRRLERGAEA